MTLPRYTHQQSIVDFCLHAPRVCNWSDPGTGKTRAHIDAFAERPQRKRALVFAPLSILEPAWGNDIKKYRPGLTYAVADAKHRKAALYGNADMVLCNHDGAKAIAKLAKDDPHLLSDFDELIVDEATAYKNLAGRGGAARARAVADIRHHFPFRRMLTGTPATNSILDLWGIAYLCDDGERLGKSYYAFRNQVTTAKQVGQSAQMVQWIEKPGALDIVSKQLEDITIRFHKRDCVDIPPNHVFTVYTELPLHVRQLYNEMLRESVVLFKSGAIANAINAGARATKLLQICTGAVYTEGGVSTLVHLERYRLVVDLIQERPWPCVVVFNWQHEREQLTQAAQSQGLSYAVLDGSTPQAQRPGIIEAFQDGKIRALFIHPQTAAHGLTLTAGRTTIWASPTANAEHFLQANARIDRNGQLHPTETILIAAKNTREEHVYNLLQGKVDRVHTLLDIFLHMKEAA